MNVRALHVPRWFEIVILVAAVLIVLIARGIASGSSGSGRAAAETAQVGASTISSPSAVALETLPPDVQAELDALPAGTVIVPCNSSEARLPEGIVPSTSLAYVALHPGWRYMLHGYCANNPTATPMPAAPVFDPAPTSGATAAP